MTVDEALVLRLAKLSRLELGDRRVDSLRADLIKILGMVEKLDELDLADVAPLRYVTEAEPSLRADREGRHLDRTRALANAPDADEEGGYFRVPRVIGGPK